MELEAAVARTKFPSFSAEQEKESLENEDSECETTRAMVARQNRKGKKSGGFQSMGKS